MQKLRVAVLRGGPSDSYEQSLITGGHVLRALSEQYEGVDIFIDKDGVWHMGGRPVIPADALHKVDVAWNALHGSFGADGEVQKAIREFGTPFTGPDAISAALASDVMRRNTAYRRAGIPSPYLKEISFETDEKNAALKLFREFPMPARILFSGRAYDPHVVTDYASLLGALRAAKHAGKKAFIEEYISGPCAGCGVVSGYRGKDKYALLPFEVKDSGHEHPGKFDTETKRQIEKLSAMAHDALGLSDYSISYFAIHPTKGPYILETDPLPPLHDGSRFAESLKAVGSTIEHFIEHTIEKLTK